MVILGRLYIIISGNQVLFLSFIMNRKDNPQPALPEITTFPNIQRFGGSKYYINPPVMYIVSSPILLPGENPGDFD